MSRRLWSALNGVVCLYKPAELSVSGLKRQLIKRVCIDGNESLKDPMLPLAKIPIVEPHPETGALLVVGEREQIDYMHHPLVCGDSFRAEDMVVEDMHFMEPSSSGICLFGVNDGCDDLPGLLAHSWVNEYRLECLLGRETYKHEIKGKVTLKADYSHVTRHRMAKLLNRIQSQYRRAAFESAEVDLQSDKAFELARKGLPRSQMPGAQIIYNLDLQLFNPPYFVLGVQSVGETDVFLRSFVHEVGVSLGTTASCLRLIRKSIGPFRSDHSLLEKQISLQNVIRNMALCRKRIAGADTTEVVKEISLNDDKEDKEVLDGLGLSPSNDCLDIEENDAMKPAWPRNYT